MSQNNLPWLVDMQGISKSFQNKKANDAIHLSLAHGEVLALLGENGAGKSTLMNILAGIYRPDEGQIFIEGSPVDFHSPQDAISAGIGMVHQHFMLVNSQTVWENIVLGTELPFLLPQKTIEQQVAQLSETYGLEIRPDAPVWQLSVGEQQRVAILKALYRNARVLVLDEPTAVLTPQEAEKLFDTVRRMTAEGRSVIFISHKLEEVMQLSHRVAVLRKGRLAGIEERDSTSKERIAELMMGEPVDLNVTKKPGSIGAVIEELRHLSALNERGLPELNDVSLSLREGEILGLAGVSGNGQTALCQAMVGLYPVTAGSILVDGEDFTGREPREFIDRGFRYIPADRRGVGMVGNMNVVENSALRRYWQRDAVKGPLHLRMDWHGMWKHALSIIKNFNVDTPSEHNPVRNLSGGNLQKLMLGRELSDRHRVLLAMNPTWGLDVAATRFVRDQLLAERERGCALFLVSEDLDELLALSDRLLVMYRGEIMGTIDNPGPEDLERLGLMMAGVKGETLS